MLTIPVSASTCYDVHVGSALLPNLGAELSQRTDANKVAILSDENVWAHYGQSVRESLENAQLQVVEYVVIPGEKSKSMYILMDILNFLAKKGLQRQDCIVALGGGVVGDLAGFCASCYLRGIDYVQVPTTLLAMVDSSVGGKTAVDLPAGKNLCGAFYQPKYVLCDTDCLNTLPAEVFRDGCAEVIKYGVLYDEALFAHLEEKGINFDRESVIARCIEWKRNVVADDEFDMGPRQMLNLGHTFGHAIEKESGYTVSHGQAVAIGMAIMARAACQKHICDGHVCQQILSVLEQFGLPITTSLHMDAIYTHALGDKKATADAVNTILPERIGCCRIEKTQHQELWELLKAGM